jgi:UDP-2,3-diacylglucosamine pyrophosphatase LpxH
MSDWLRHLQASPPGRVLVVSDLHLGEGQDAVTRRYARTENFFADARFARLLAAEARAGALLVLNGDTFDFLRITAWPREREQLDEWSALLTELGQPRDAATLLASISGRERGFGLRTDDYKSVWKLRRIAQGHPGFFTALARWIAQDGLVLFVKGNHDLELYWPLVQAAVRAEIVKRGADPAVVQARAFFCDDAFSLANLYIEHGHRFEPLTAVAGPPELPGNRTQLTLPVGSFVNRYLINPVERLEPFLDNTKPVTNVLWLLLRRHPIKALGILWRSWRFILRAVKARRALASAGVFLYLLALLVPLLTMAIIALAFAWPVVGQWVMDTFGRYRTPLSLLGLAAPYLVGAVRDLFPKRRPRVGEDRFAEGAYAALVARGGGARMGTTQYALLGHTHEQDVQRLPAIGGSAVLYLNSGTWIPLWDVNRPDLVGQILHPFLCFTWNGSLAYTHEYFEWVDGGGPTDDPVVFERPNAARR